MLCTSQRGKFAVWLSAIEIVMIAMFAWLVEFDKSLSPFFPGTVYKVDHRNASMSLENAKTRNEENTHFFSILLHVNVMLFVGVGYLLSFLKRHGFSSIGLNFLIGCVAVQWSIIAGGLFHLNDNGNITLDINTLLLRDVAAVAVVISWCSVIGKLSPLQTVIFTLLEIPVYHVNEWIMLEFIKVSDIAGSIWLHVFSAYFGLSTARVMYREDVKKVEGKIASVYNSDLFCMIGTVILWIYWPSFNSAILPGDERYRAVINTYLALCGSVAATYAVSSLADQHGKLDMAHVQNASLAGGVAIGAAADMLLQPWVALLVGMLAGVICTLGFRYLSPVLERRLKLHDSCGVHNLHAMPGVLSAVVSAVLAGLAEYENYGPSLYEIFPARAPVANSSELEWLQRYYVLEGGDGRSALTQALYQLAALGVTVIIAVIGGLITGGILKLPIWSDPPEEGLFDDSQYWLIPDGIPDPDLEYFPSANGLGLKAVESQNTKI